MALAGNLISGENDQFLALQFLQNGKLGAYLIQKRAALSGSHKL